VKEKTRVSTSWNNTPAPATSAMAVRTRAPGTGEVA